MNEVALDQGIERDEKTHKEENEEEERGAEESWEKMGRAYRIKPQRTLSTLY